MLFIHARWPWGYEQHDIDATGQGDGYSDSLANASPTRGFPYMHTGWRYYAPATGRFLQRDPIGLRGGLNVYVYVTNNPSSAIDPSGLQSVDTWGRRMIEDMRSSDEYKKWMDEGGWKPPKPSASSWRSGRGMLRDSIDRDLAAIEGAYVIYVDATSFVTYVLYVETVLPSAVLADMVVCLFLVPAFAGEDFDIGDITRAAWDGRP